MAIPKFEEDLDIIGKLGTIPSVDDGLSEAAFKAKFDEGPKKIAKFLNERLIGPLNALVDVQSLLNSILDTSLSLADKAANAKSTGDALAKKLSLSGGDMTGIINMNGRSITNVGTPTSDGSAAPKSYVDSKHFYSTAQIPVSGWSSSAPFTQTVSAPGVREEDDPHIAPLYSSNQGTRIKEKYAFSCLDDVQTSADKITLICFEDKPEASFTIKLEVNR